MDGKRVTVMGLGLFGGGIGVTRYLVKRGAKVTVTDLRTQEELREAVRSLQGSNVSFHLGGHMEQDFIHTDLIVVNPAVPLDSPYLRLAKERGIPLESEINLFFKLCPAPIVGITGSNGKSTTVALLAEVLKRSPLRWWIGGNIGHSLLEDVQHIQPQDIVILELSSFQLETLGYLRKSPWGSVVLNIYPNHLDRHGELENYIKVKRNIVAYQDDRQWAILNRDSQYVCGFENHTRAKVFPFSLEEFLPYGVSLLGDRIVLIDKGHTSSISIRGSRLPGRFNLQNMLAAYGVLHKILEGRWEEWVSVSEEVFNTFEGIKHRLEFVGERRGVIYYNDSIATNPMATISALEALQGPLILIAGGSDKKLDFDRLGDIIAKRVKALLLMGQTATKIKETVLKYNPALHIELVSDLREAVEAAKSIATAGDIVLLSPACASYDMFRNFAERGDLFKGYVEQTKV
jgi:UDP-N-acetylmuramoylalanine--D-glutamate ligase